VVLAVIWEVRVMCVADARGLISCVGTCKLGSFILVGFLNDIPRFGVNG
jgi:hypothetical protein